MRHEIKAVQQQVGITAIHVTHDREEAMVMADRIAIMNGGEIVQIGPPEEVYNRPADPFVAAFMGADNVIGVEVRQPERRGAARGRAAQRCREPALRPPSGRGRHSRRRRRERQGRGAFPQRGREPDRRASRRG